MTLKSMVQVFNNTMFMWSYLKTEKGLVFKCFVETFGIKGNNSYIYTKEEKQYRRETTCISEQYRIKGNNSIICTIQKGNNYLVLHLHNIEEKLHMYLYI